MQSIQNIAREALKQLLRDAPGTYHHSLMVSNLCEAAAEAVGANPILARVGAFYHDKELLHPDSTANGHEEAEDFGEKECVREADKSPWGYHYHFTEITNRS